MNRGLQEGDMVRGQGSQATAEQEIFFFKKKKCQYFTSAIIIRKKKGRIRRRRQERDYGSASHCAGKDSVF